MGSVRLGLLIPTQFFWFPLTNVEVEMSHRFPPLAAQTPIRNRYYAPLGTAPSERAGVLMQLLPKTSLPCLEIGLTLALLVTLRMS